ncbi:MAG: IscS subfamily cysteine desulfurase [Clostridia bacterium]|uniref:cysteine desulfurase n=1 Tax=Mogibacterium kristiansenii TaxID=2606708 RepID=A0A6N7XHG9_9FIRM|nr:MULTISPECIES: IscS subfamily cysteine desulfurase [Mogibacterium]MDY5450817.1 IscS subfamily cysteine desulfurase [Clostridia bacterium]MCI7123649.1 IscS subfamily cysteine desulfurase [Mogibacterium sp.]MDD6700455.1 IscS subfamily cysteine desulfurase [Mogibacterium kristiansenii]MEE0369788.1 IscS subfamily cysteine desulfurase [Clostridia bacterium]MST70688.1 aminotransferase class V-fold PLP-dependent enzyme [Mogibacterium kristiansenii]
MRVYADNAATTYISETAMNTLVDCLKNYNSNPNSLHTEGQITAEKLAESREKVAKAINAANPNEIYFTSGGSEADNQALLSAARVLKDKGKKHLVSLNIEHHAILHTLKKLEKEGFEVTLLAPESNGIVDVNKVRDAIREDTALVSIMFANNEMGAIQPIPEIGAICKEKGVLFHTDAVQAAAHLPIDVQAMNIDMLSMSAHKFHGPKGVGVLYARNGIRLVNVIEGGAQERGKRAGTCNVPGNAALAAALEEGVANMEANAKKTAALRDRLIQGLSDIPHSKLNGDPVKRLPGNVNYSFEGVEGESLLLALDEEGIRCSSGSACTSESLDPSHVLMGMGVPVEAAHGSLRFSLNEENTEEEVDYIIEKVHEIVALYRKMSPFWEELEKGEREHVI